MALMKPEQISVGMTIMFKTTSMHDNVVYKGSVESLCSYDIARRFTDVDLFYQHIGKVMSDIPPKELEKYFLLKFKTGDTIETRAFGISWVDPSTLQEVKENTHVDIRVHDIDERIAGELLTYINSLGYLAEIKKD